MKEVEPIVIQFDVLAYADARSAQDQQQIIDVARRLRQRMVHYKEWVKPDNISLRLDEKKLREEKEKAWEKEFGPRFAPLPDVIPEEMKGQQPSTIRLMLEADGWEYDWKELKWFRN